MRDAMNRPICLILLAGALALTGCATINVQSNAYLGSPHYPPGNPANVRILPAEPKEPLERLGQVFLSVDGSPSREELEKRLRAEAAKLGADAVYVTSDRMRIVPYVYWDPWWGPTGPFESSRRDIAAVAVKLK